MNPIDQSVEVVAGQKAPRTRCRASHGRVDVSSAKSRMRGSKGSERKDWRLWKRLNDGSMEYGECSVCRWTNQPPRTRNCANAPWAPDELILL